MLATISVVFVLPQAIVVGVTSIRFVAEWVTVFVPFSSFYFMDVNLDFIS